MAWCRQATGYYITDDVDKVRDNAKQNNHSER